MKHLIVQFDNSLLQENGAILHQLAELYCDIWSNDQNFGEYMVCPTCNRYHNHTEAIQSSSLCKTCQTPLVLAWEVAAVKQSVIKVSTNRGFFGLHLFIDNTLQGFAWSTVREHQEMVALWPGLYPSMSSESMTPCVYINELAVHPIYQRLGFGTQMFRMIVEHAIAAYPNYTGAVATHFNSPAVDLYRHSGFIILGAHPTGQGRIALGINLVSKLSIRSN